LTDEHYNILLTTCTDPAVAKEIIQEMCFSRRHRQGVIPPSLISYTKALAPGRMAKDLTKARSLLTTARNDGMLPEVLMYTTAVWTAAGAQRAKAAVAHFAQIMRRSNQGRATIVSYNGVLAALASSLRHGALAYNMLADFSNNNDGLKTTVYDLCFTGCRNSE
jgi:hypothetical protein